MLSLLMLLLDIMTSVTASSGNKQSAQSTVISCRKLIANLFGSIKGRRVRICRYLYARGKEKLQRRSRPNVGRSGACSPRKFFNL